MKRFLNLFIIIGAILLVILFGYFLRSRTTVDQQNISNTDLSANSPLGTPSSETITTQPPLLSESTSSDSSEEDTFTIVSNIPIRDYFVFNKDHIIVVDLDGKIIEITNGKSTGLSSVSIANIISTSFSYDGQNLLAIFGDSNNIQASVFNLSKRSWQSLRDTNILSPVWAPHTNTIAYLKKKNDITSLFLLNPLSDKEKPRLLADTYLQDFTLSWSNPDFLLVTEKSSVYSKTGAFLFKISDRSFHSLIRDTRGVDLISNKDATSYLLSTSRESKKGGDVSILNSQGGLYKKLSFLTLASKCIFSQITDLLSSVNPQPMIPIVICAVPRNSQQLSSTSLPDDYWKKKITTADDIIQVRLTDGVVSPLFDDQNYSIDATLLRVYDDAVYFVDRYNHNLYRTPIQ